MSHRAVLDLDQETTPATPILPSPDWPTFADSDVTLTFPSFFVKVRSTP